MSIIRGNGALMGTVTGTLIYERTSKKAYKFSGGERYLGRVVKKKGGGGGKKSQKITVQCMLLCL